MHITKLNGNQIGQVISHIERPADREYSNQNIDPARSKLNYTLIDRGGTDYINNRIESVKHINRADVIKLVGVVVTLPQDYRGNEKEFFKATTKAFAERYGKDNIAYATVHKDEKTPHLHIGVIPIVKDKDGRERLCAKELFDKKELKRLHPEIEKSVSRQLKQPVHLLNGRTQRDPETGRAYKDVKELKEKKAKEERELPRNLLGVDYKRAYEQEREKNIEKSLEIGKLKKENRDLQERLYRQTERAKQAEKGLRMENEERNRLQDILRDPEKLQEHIKQQEQERIRRNAREEHKR